jgi:hypothetical protein
MALFKQSGEETVQGLRPRSAGPRSAFPPPLHPNVDPKVSRLPTFEAQVVSKTPKDLQIKYHKMMNECLTHFIFGGGGRELGRGRDAAEHHLNLNPGASELSQFDADVLDHLPISMRLRFKEIVNACLFRNLSERLQVGKSCVCIPHNFIFSLRCRNLDADRRRVVK